MKDHEWTPVDCSTHVVHRRQKIGCWTSFWSVELPVRSLTTTIWDHNLSSNSVVVYIDSTYHLQQFLAWHSGNAFHPINEVTLCRMGDCLRAGKPSRYVTSHLGQLSFSSLRGRYIEYWPVWLGLRWGTFTCVFPYGRWCSISLRFVNGNIEELAHRKQQKITKDDIVGIPLTACVSIYT